jgi:hypothetical protein
MGEEIKIEARLRLAVLAKAGLCLKFSCPSFTGVPDRIILLPFKKIYFVETKAPNGVLSPRQKYVHGLIALLGFPVIVLYTKSQVDEFIKTIS